MSERRSPSPEECKWLFEKLEKQARRAEAERKRIMIRFLCDLLIALLIAGTIYAAWLSLRPNRAPMLSTLSGYICTPSIERLRAQTGHPKSRRGCGSEPLELPAWPFAPAQGVE